MNATSHEARPVRLIRGGTAPGEVEALSGELAARLRRRRGEGPPASGPLPILVPVAPQEDLDTVRSDLRRRLGAVPSRTDLIVRTSGSTTGTGRLVAMSVEALEASARATHGRLGGPGQWVLALPTHHIAGLQILIRSIVAGRAPVVVDTTSGFTPSALADGVLRATKDAGAPVYTSLVPAQLRRLLATGNEAAAHLARATAVLLGGDAADPDLLQRARRAGIAVVTTYGMSETGGGCVYDGIPLDGVTVRLTDTGADGVGRIVLSGPMLAEGYAEVDAAPSAPDSPDFVGLTESADSSGSAGDGAGVMGLTASAGSADDGAGPRTGASGAESAGRRWLIPADRGRLGADGRLEVLGRVDDLIITGGLKVDPHQVEEVLIGLDGVAEACVVGVPDPHWGRAVVAAVVPATGARPQALELQAAARARLGGAHAPKRIEILESLPERGPGKIDRLAVAQRLSGRPALGSQRQAGRTP